MNGSEQMIDIEFDVSAWLIISIKPIHDSNVFKISLGELSVVNHF